MTNPRRLLWMTGIAALVLIAAAPAWGASAEEEAKASGRLKEQLRVAEAEKAHLEDQMEGLALRTHKAEKEAAVAVAEKSQIQTRLDQTDEQLRQSEAQVEDLKKQRADLKSALDRAQKEAGEAKREQVRIQEQARRDVASAKADRDKLSKQIDQLQVSRRDYDKVSAELASAKDRVAELIVALDTQEKLIAQQTGAKK